MGYESSSAAKRQGSKAEAGFARRKHRSSTPKVKVKDANVACYHHLTGKEGLLATKRQLPGYALALTQGTRPGFAKLSELKRCKAVAQAEATKARRERGQYKTIKSSNVKANRKLTSKAGHTLEASALYIIKPSPCKGLGMFAKQDILKGTRILAEKPFFSLAARPRISSTDPYAPNDITEAFDRLRVGEKRKYMSLYCPERSDCTVVVSIYEANCFEMGAGTCICLDASRINHSCVPNSHFSWNTNIERVTLHAAKEIPKGEEITISYCSAIRTLEERRRELKPYVFTCDCPACQPDTNFGLKSQIRRRQMRDLDHEIADYQNDPPAARAEYGHRDEWSAILQLVNLIDQEGLVYEKALAYHDAAECALKRGLREKALKYASMELGMDLYCAGKDSPSSHETMTFFQTIYLGAERVLK